MTRRPITELVVEVVQLRGATRHTTSRRTTGVGEQ